MTEIKIKLRNGAAATLRHNDGNGPEWDIMLNGERIGGLDNDEAFAMAKPFVPAAALRAIFPMVGFHP